MTAAYAHGTPMPEEVIADAGISTKLLTSCGLLRRFAETQHQPIRFSKEAIRNRSRLPAVDQRLFGGVLVIVVGEA